MRRARDERLPEAERRRCRDLAIHLNLGLADSLPRRYRARGEDLDDLIQVARIGLIQAVRRFDPDNGSFLSFAVPTITGEIKRHFRDHCWTVRPPRRLQELHGNVGAAWSELAQERAATPTAADVGERIGASRAEVRESLHSNAFRSASLDTNEGLSLALGVLGTTDDGFECVEDDLERRELLRRVDEACGALSEDERRLLRLRFGHGRSQASIADELHISQMSVSRRLRKLTQRLRVEVTRSSSPAHQSLRRRPNVLPRQPARA